MKVLRVQTIASKSKDAAIPVMFVRGETEQPGITTVQGVNLEVPIIDFSDPDEGKLQNVGKEFFELPQEEKELIAKPAGSDSIEGYGTKLQKEVNGKKGWVDHLFHTVWPPSSIDYRYWPKNPPSYREVNEEYCSGVDSAASPHFVTPSPDSRERVASPTSGGS
ncbi:hypothetical protein JHK82_040201 [Glycine max]|nr:hypothetical protein JHK82_040201 [Glycine max]